MIHAWVNRTRMSGYAPPAILARSSSLSSSLFLSLHLVDEDPHWFLGLETNDEVMCHFAESCETLIACRVFFMIVFAFLFVCLFVETTCSGPATDVRHLFDLTHV